MSEPSSYTAAQVATLAGVGVEAIRSLHSRDRMPKGRLEPRPGGGRQLLFDKAAIDEWLPTRPGRGRPRVWVRKRVDEASEA